MDKRELLLRKRIARLESLVRASKLSSKNEEKISNKSDFLVGSIVEDLNGDESVVIDMGSFKDMYDKWYSRLMPANKESIDDYLDELDGEDWVDDGFTIVTKFSRGGGIAMSVDPEYELEVIGGVGDDYEFESCSRRKNGRRMMKRESRRSIKREAVLTLPNGMPATTVADVLSGWADTDYHRPEAAIRKLRMAETFDGSGRRENVLAKATNRWYPTEEDVAEAIEDCWRDPVNSSLAKLFASDFGDYTQMALSIMPATSSSGSRTQDITLKFQWKNPTRD